MLPSNIQLWLKQQLNKSIESIAQVSGGCINDCYQVVTSCDKRFFVKYHPAQTMFEAESVGLKAISDAVTGLAPQVLAVHHQAMVLEWLEERPASSAFWKDLAKQLADLHSNTQDSFGFVQDNYCGLTPQQNKPDKDGYRFFAEQRLQYQARIAYDSGRLNSEDLSAIEKVCFRLPELVPAQKAVLIHGDLWSGNLMNTAEGPKLFDPACYYGWPEAELAMTTLFGGFDDVFYQEYQMVSGISESWRERAKLYNLYHLLNHLNLFGGSYLSSVRQVLKPFYD
ncbi:MAG: fructosamine kinase family protein [Gammaproteobacteria bacterium]|nr:fructosamine kinase family protein [Gammaproteobacteria bacterium]